jgi:23S rRNA A1618 N6-methylase RlmF
MKGKLIKSKDQYSLYNEEGILIATSTDNKLSVKNCKAIEMGYDFDWLAEEFAKKKSSNPTFHSTHIRDFKAGFQTALEINSDKFNEFEVYKIWKAGQEYWKTSGESMTFEELVERRKELLQQTEWDVEIDTNSGEIFNFKKYEN